MLGCCVHVCSEAQPRLTLGDPTDCRLPGSSVHGTLQARLLAWAATSYSKGPSRPGDQTCISRTGRRTPAQCAAWDPELASTSPKQWIQKADLNCPT